MRKKMQGILKNLNLNNKIQTIFVGVGIVNLLFLGIFALYYIDDISRYSLENDKKLLESSIGVMGAEIQNVNNITRLLITDASVREYLAAADENTKQAAITVQDKLYNYIILRDYISSIYIIRNDAQKVSAQMTLTYTNESVISGNQWKTNLDEEKGKAVLRYNGDEAFRLKNENPLLSYMRAVYDLDTQDRIGYLSVNLRMDFFDNTLQTVTEDPESGILIQDMKGNLLVKEGIGESLEHELNQEKGDICRMVTLNGKRYTLIREEIPRWGIRITSLRKSGYSKKHYSGLFTFLLIYLLFTFACWMGIHYFIRKKITVPMGELVKSMDQVRSGWLRRVSMKTDNDEIGLLKDSYNAMLIEINKLLNHLLEKETEKYRLELDALQEQIKPHFLYNTLYTIEYIALRNGDRETFESLQTLSSFYRNFLSKGNREIPVSQELRIVSDYLKLQSLRYSDIFTVEITVEEDARNCYVPKLMLQPLVENSIYHGIRPKGEPGIIKIDVKANSEFLYFSIFDTGIGMSQEKSQSILQAENSKSFGLKATIERLELFYERKDICTINSEEGEFTEICLRIPKRREVSYEEKD